MVLVMFCFHSLNLLLLELQNVMPSGYNLWFPRFLCRVCMCGFRYLFCFVLVWAFWGRGLLLFVFILECHDPYTHEIIYFIWALEWFSTDSVVFWSLLVNVPKSKFTRAIYKEQRVKILYFGKSWCSFTFLRLFWN